jgi:hypothetical protein
MFSVCFSVSGQRSSKTIRGGSQGLSSVGNSRFSRAIIWGYHWVGVSISGSPFPVPDSQESGTLYAFPFLKTQDYIRVFFLCNIVCALFSKTRSWYIDGCSQEREPILNLSEKAVEGYVNTSLCLKMHKNGLWGGFRVPGNGTLGNPESWHPCQWVLKSYPVGVPIGPQGSYIGVPRSPEGSKALMV